MESFVGSKRSRVAALPTDYFAIARRRMVEHQLAARGIRDERVLKIMGELPRHIFVDEALQNQSYGDYPLGIGEGQTISQPYTVALMSQTLELRGKERVLEIGTGCGYQTAVLSSLAMQIFTIERIKSLGLKARQHLRFLGCRNVILRIGDGSQGWPAQAPFDCILIAAGAPAIPEPLLEQLVEGGRLVLPVGTESNQRLLRITKRSDLREPVVEDLGSCRFVKLVGTHGWQKQRKVGEKFVKRSVV